MRTRHYFVYSILLLCIFSPALADQRAQIVQLWVEGFWQDNKYEPPAQSRAGTGFFVSDKGYILTAAHVVAARRSRNENPKDRIDQPAISIRVIKSDGGILEIKPDDCAVVYVDKAIDLALIATRPIANRKGLPLAGELVEEPGDKIKALTMGPVNGTNMVPIEGTFKSMTNFGKHYPGLMDVNFSGVSPGDSGSPIINSKGEVIGVLIKGDEGNNTARVAVPITFAAPMLSMAGIAYPRPAALEDWLNSDEKSKIGDFKSALNELKREVSIVSFTYSKEPDSLNLQYEKRLETGYAPQSIKLLIRPRDKAGLTVGDLWVSMNVDPEGDKPRKIGSATYVKFSSLYKQFIREHNEKTGDTYKLQDLPKFEISSFVAVWSGENGQEIKSTLLGEKKIYEIGQ